MQAEDSAFSDTFKKIPEPKYFNFNNTALFEEMPKDDIDELTAMKQYWKARYESFDDLFTKKLSTLDR